MAKALLLFCRFQNAKHKDTASLGSVGFGCSDAGLKSKIRSASCWLRRGHKPIAKLHRPPCPSFQPDKASATEGQHPLSGKLSVSSDSKINHAYTALRWGFWLDAFAPARADTVREPSEKSSQTLKLFLFTVVRLSAESPSEWPPPVYSRYSPNSPNGDAQGFDLPTNQ